MAENQVMTMVGAFIAVAIMLSVGVVILGSATDNCDNVPGFNTGVVESIAVTAGGANYTSGVTVVISGGGGTGATATATRTGTAISAVTVTDGGQDYTSAPSVTFSDVNGTGAGASATIAAGHSGWAEQCLSIEDQSINGYQLLGVVLIVIAAVVILAVIRML